MRNIVFLVLSGNDCTFGNIYGFIFKLLFVLFVRGNERKIGKELSKL